MVLLTLLDLGLSGKHDSQMSPITSSPGQVQNSIWDGMRFGFRAISNSVRNKMNAGSPGCPLKVLAYSPIYSYMAHTGGPIPRSLDGKSAPHACAIHNPGSRACAQVFRNAGPVWAGILGPAQQAMFLGPAIPLLHSWCWGGEGCLSLIPYGPVLGRYTGPQWGSALQVPLISSLLALLRNFCNLEVTGPTSFLPGDGLFLVLFCFFPIGSKYQILNRTFHPWFNRKEIAVCISTKLFFKSFYSSSLCRRCWLYDILAAPLLSC